MDEDEGGGGGVGRLSKRVSEGEVDYKTKAGTAWSHSYLNQKPWHPLSYPNQRRKWIAEQTHANHSRRNEEVAREFAQEQEFFRQTALFSKKEKEKVEMMKAVSFMYVRPPGYNAESAKAAEISDERKRSDQNNVAEDPTNGTPPAMLDMRPHKNQTGGDKKARPKDVFGRALPTEEEFEVLKNAPRLETGVPVRNKPFGVEIRNVRCVRCGTYGHQSGDRECPLKDAIMPNDESRLKRDDPLTAIMAQTDSSEPLKWELKQKPGMSPPRGGYRPDDPNQQIVADDIFDEYGGFLSGGDIPALLSNFSANKPGKHTIRRSKHKRRSSDGRLHHGNHPASSESEVEREKKGSKSKVKKKKKKKKKKRHRSDSSTSDTSDSSRHRRRSKHRHDSDSSASNVSDLHHRHRRRRRHRHRQRSNSSSESD